MNLKDTRRAACIRVARISAACAAFAVIAACGGGGDDNNTPALPPGGVKLQVVSFGDSLSDVGTYAPVVTSSFGGGRFTTNPGQVWTQNVAQYYGDTLTAAQVGGFGKPLVAAGGYGYAQGGSRVALQPGQGHATTGAATDAYSQATTIPVTAQLTQYLTDHGSFNANQLVLLNGGANDIFAALTAVATAKATDPTTVPAALQAATLAVGTAAYQLAGVAQAILAKGATHVVVSGIPDIGGTPLGVSDPTQTALISQVSKGFNDALQARLAALGIANKVIYIDAYGWVDGITANYQSNGFTVSNTGTACNLQSMVASATANGLPNPTGFGSSLFCSPQTYTAPNADQTYMYADTVHPTTHLHSLFSQYVESRIAQSGLGK